MKQNPFFAVSKNWIIIAIKKGFYTNVFLSLTNGSFSVTNRIQTILIHVAIWLFYWGLELLVIVAYQSDYNPVELFANITLNTGMFYVILYVVFPRHSTKVPYLKLIIGLLVVMIVALSVKISYTYLLEKRGDFLLYKVSNLIPFLTGNIFRFTLFAIYASFIWFFTTKNKLDKQLLAKELEKERLQNALLRAEYATLRSQINPHFIFNTLSFIHSKTVNHSNEIASRSILLLADVLRYSLAEKAEDETIELNNELDFVRKIHEMNRLRFNDRCFVEINSTGEAYKKRVPPFILLTLFENAMKHGDFQNDNNPIRIQIRQTSDKIGFTVANIKREAPSLTGTESFGIGFSYIEKILDAFYKKKYILEVQQDAQHYKLELTILNP